MKKVNLLQNIKKVHFVGVGGVSMSSLASLLKHKGFLVSGSDSKDSTTLAKLTKEGITTYVGHSKENIKGADLVVYTAAISKDNVELIEARAQGIVCIERARLLADICNSYKNIIAIAGMHGKTTTTAMLAQVFIDCGKNPTVHIGADFDKIGGNIHIGKEEFFITEACEYKDSFLSLSPSVAVVTNIDKEHLDYFKNIDNIKRSFNKFCKQSKQVVVNAEYAKLIDCENITFGKDADYYASNISCNKGKFSFDVCYQKVYLCHLDLNVPGKHNIYNALATIAVACEYNLPIDKVAKSLSNFAGVSRRFEYMCVFNGAPVIRDYAHHPTEIKCVIDTAIACYNRPIMVVFQPHTYSRTKTLFKDFLTCFSNAESVVLIDTYSAREKYSKEGSCEALAQGLGQVKGKARVFGCFTKTQAVDFLKGCNVDGKVILFLGAGDIVEVIKELKI